MLSVKVNDSAFKGYLAKLSRNLQNMQPVMEGVGLALEAAVSGRFESRTDPMGGAWAPWAQSTRDSYPDDANGRLLDRYDDMLRGLSHQADENSVRVGFDQDYSTFHEFGTDHMPRRGLLFDDPDAGTLGEDDERAVLDVLGDWLNRISA